MNDYTITKQKPWMVAEILESEFIHNNGTLVNDIYFDFTVTDM